MLYGKVIHTHTYVYIYLRRRLLRVPWTARRSNESILKEINPAYSLEGLMLNLKCQLLWPSDVKYWLIGKDPDGGKDWRQEKGMREDEMVGWHQQLNGHEFEQTPGDGEEWGSLVCCSPWDHKESDKTVWLNNNNHSSFFSPINIYQARMCKLQKKK